MKKNIIILLLCICSLLFYNCGIKSISVNTNTSEESYQTATQKSGTTDETYQNTTQEINTTIDPGIAALVNISNKKVDQYTLDDCFTLLNSSMGDIGKAYNLDMASEPKGGLILPGSTLAGPVVTLTDGIFVTCEVHENFDKNGYPVDIDLDTSPYRIYFYGDYGQPCIIDGFQFRMNLDQVDEEYLAIAKDNFYKLFEPTPPIPAKWIEIHEKGMIITLIFEQGIEEENFYLNYICVTFNEIL